ncbi:Uroporphyrinogen decarboxylase (URO-D) [Roseovarius albus]|uniref:Uroporphyrinogen decarboxylase (URO-D) n=1 Tax=Roseovarius albus TaxID=1247867 RepID=A0A1X6ZQR9_9RHOB|nr:uroporphyrinogen decarboxylase family protein [Roseovarius albus]SLN58615.1 Uroporphyrinogen decarboxylase (URO-D) [Roseovarius albus]
MTDLKDYPFPSGLHLLQRWQAGDQSAKEELTRVFDAAIAGNLDENFKLQPSPDRVHSTASVHMLTLSALNDLYGIETREYYHEDPYRYVRANLAVTRLMGVSKLYITWSLYAWTCEPLGQTMMYPDKYPPGADPDDMLIKKDNWHELETPDFNSGVPLAIDNILKVMQELTGASPTLQITAPYSLAADIYGQEPLLADVVNDPDTVNALLDHLGDTVLAPWMDHHFELFPDGWVELSDASGSPFFIGPENCKNMSIRSIRHMLRDKPYADRVFDNNYRGDYVAEVTKKSRSSRRRGAANTSDHATTRAKLLELTDAKVSVNPLFVMRLEADKVDVSFYEEQAISRNMPLTIGVGSPEIDRNSIEDLGAAKIEAAEKAKSFVSAIRRVCEVVDLPEDNHVGQSWPSHLYFEDVNGQSQFELVELILREVHSCPPFERSNISKQCVGAN